MPPDDWLRVKDLFASAVALAPNARAAYLHAACADDELRARVAELLAAHDSASSFLETIAAIPSPRVPGHIGPYRVTGTLGQGGMGVVYDAVDDRLGRRVALKVLHADIATRSARDRFAREARLAASVNHARICQIYDIGSEGGFVFLALERLEGESLAERLRAGPLSCTDAVNVCLEVLSALDALHRLGIVHRDLKPSNVFLTPHGVKLLDFGLARATSPDADTQAPLTLPGMIVGTPRYMAPEQIRSAAIDERADLFAASTMLYEMLTGTAPFDGPSIPAVLDKILHVDPPMIVGSRAVEAVDRVVHRGLSKDPQRRYQTAEAMAEALRGALQFADNDGAGRATAVTRLIVLPFRLLTPDADIEFLSFSLADSIASSLSTVSSLVVRSTLVAGAAVLDSPDLATIAATANVDVVLSGSLVRAGTRLRVAVQLVEAPSGRLIWSDAAQVDDDDIFALQDTVTRKIVESLARPLSGREQRALGHDVPSSAQAYEFYLRATQLSRDSQSIDVAKDMYLEAVRLDPNYAPAWARLGHLHRVLGKYRADRDSIVRAESALNRALELNPDLAFADRALAQIEVDYGRAQDAMVRLLRRTAIRANDADLFAGLVHSCRYCGLFDASSAAHERALRLDPNVRTSIQYTLLMAGQYEQALAAASGYDSVRGLALAMIGDPEAPRRLREQADQLLAVNMAPMAGFANGVAAMIEGDVRPLRTAIDLWIESGLRDPEALFIHGLFLTGGGECDRGMELMTQSLGLGYLPYETLSRHRWLDPLRDRRDFNVMGETMRERHEAAVAAFKLSGGIPI